MKNKIGEWKVIFLLGVLLFMFDITFAKERESDCSSAPDSSFSATDSSLFLNRFIRRFGLEVRPEYIVPTNPFLKGENDAQKKIQNSLSVHLKYSFQHQLNSCMDRIYGGAYQGIGFASYSFGNPRELGDPVAFYLFQGARIARFTPQLSFNYEWNFGISSGWEPYDEQYNSRNIMVGSRVNAYINMDFYLNWMLSRQVDLNSGITLSHFSNGNTKFPNAGLNSLGLKVGLIYNFNRESYPLAKPLYRSEIPEFTRHISYDLVLFGSWRRKGVVYEEKRLPSPNAYTVLGFNFAPMYNFGYKFRAGVSLDGVYDGSANVYARDYSATVRQEFSYPHISRQLALGLSARAEYVMPYFTVGLGMGVNVLHGGGDLDAFYQVLALKTEITRNSFLHIGYCLQDFHMPNFLMLGVGFRFNNKYPVLHR